MAPNIGEVKDQIYREIEEAVRENFVVLAGSPEALQQFESLASSSIAASEAVDVRRIKLLGLRFASDGHSIVFNGYRIIPA